VLFIHGIHSAPGHLDFWRHRAEAANFSPYCFTYPTKGSAPEIADALAAVVLELYTAHDTGVAMVGHSLGGVLAALAAVQLGSAHPDAISDVVAVCSPFDGAALAKAAFLGPSRHLLHDLCHGSALLENLREGLTRTDSATRWSSVGLHHDGVVSDASARLPNPQVRHVTLSGENHLSVLISTAITDHIVSVIGP
jgi:pimeloyl-ACP methyl ester carboxylesterase